LIEGTSKTRSIREELALDAMLAVRQVCLGKQELLRRMNWGDPHAKFALRLLRRNSICCHQFSLEDPNRLFQNGEIEFKFNFVFTGLREHPGGMRSNALDTKTKSTLLVPLSLWLIGQRSENHWVLCPAINDYDGSRRSLHRLIVAGETPIHP
jgi:hypothetical protein